MAPADARVAQAPSPLSSTNRGPRRNWLRGAGVVARTLLISFLAAELFLRFFRPIEFRAPGAPLPQAEQAGLLFQHSALPGLLYEMTPNREKIVDGSLIKTNSFGMRDREPSPNGTANLFRIAAIGDSFMFGLGIPLERALPKVLEGLLNDSAAGRHYEVLNLAVPGYGTQDEAVAFTEKGLPWQPQLVVLGYCLNDPEIEPLQPLHAYFHTPAWWEHSHFLRLLSLWQLLLDERIYGGGDYYAYLHAPQRAPWRSVVTAFERIRRVTRDRGIPVLVIIFPMNEVTTWAEYRYTWIHRQVADAAQASGFQVVDLLPVFMPYEPRALRLSSADQHPNVLGHQLAAHAVYDALQQNGATAR